MPIIPLSKQCFVHPMHGFYLAILFLFFSCQSPADDHPQTLQIAHLSQGDQEAFQKIRDAFAQRNPGYDMAYHASIDKLSSVDYPRIVFIQEGEPDIELSSGLQSKITVGDIVILKQGESMSADSLLSVLAFQVPEAPADSIPAVIRPDWDEHITDIPGGCATETNAYRRILLTWKQEVGHYLYHALNAHRVRIMDSFSHYHPTEGGFDEFYLVQMALPDARIITSDKVERIINPTQVTKAQAESLLHTTSLQVGDLVYLPRGTMHRGIGGVLAQVITVPGFIPGSEIGVDHHLKAINERLSLDEAEMLPYNAAASVEAVVK